MVANKYAFLQITRRRFLNEWEAFKKVISRRNIRRRITIPLTLSNLKLLRRITRTENILHRNFTRRQVAIQNRVASNIGISQSTFSVKVLNLFSRSRRKTNKRKSKHSAMLRNKETRQIFTFYVPHRHVYGEQWIKFMKDGVNATPLPTVNTTGYIDHAAFLGTINPDTNKIPKHLFQGYLNIYNNYFKAPWMPDRTE